VALEWGCGTVKWDWSRGRPLKFLGEADESTEIRYMSLQGSSLRVVNQNEVPTVLYRLPMEYIQRSA